MKETTIESLVELPKTEQEKVSIVWSSQKNGLNEIYSTGPQFSFCSANNEQVSKLMTCRDFLNEQVQAQVHGNSTGIYGMTFNPATDPNICFDETIILVTNQKDKDFLNKVPALLKFMHEIEDYLGLKHTQAFVVENPPTKYAVCGVIKFVSSRRWILSPVLLSLYTLFIRVGFVHNINKSWFKTVQDVISGDVYAYQTNDKAYLQRAMPGIRKIFLAGYKNIFFIKMENNYPKECDVSTMHNSGGIVAFGEKRKAIKKHWHRPEIEEIVKANQEKESIIFS